MKITAPGVPAVIVVLGGLQGRTSSYTDTESVSKKRKKAKPNLL